MLLLQSFVKTNTPEMNFFSLREKVIPVKISAPKGKLKIVNFPKLWILIGSGDLF